MTDRRPFNVRLDEARREKNEWKRRALAAERRLEDLRRAYRDVVLQIERAG